MLFLKNIIGIINSLPLVLSDTTEPQDVSLNRVITVAVALVILAAPPLTAIYAPQFWDKMADLWKALLVFLGGQTAGNIFAKIKRGNQ